MNRERANGVLAFLVLFVIGLALYNLIDTALAPSKPIVQEESPAAGGVSEAAALVSPSVVGLPACKKEEEYLTGATANPLAQE